VFANVRPQHMTIYSLRHIHSQAFIDRLPASLSRADVAVIAAVFV